MPHKLHIFTKLASFAVFGFSRLVAAQSMVQQDWPSYGNDAGGSRYGSAQQIDRGNVANLKLAWSYRTGAAREKAESSQKAAFEVTPIVVENKLFLSTPYSHVIALDPQTGRKLWEFNPGVNLSQNFSEVVSRGVSAWRDAHAKPGRPCQLRIFIGTLDARLISLDGQTGKPCAGFGSKGEISLARDVELAPEWHGGY
jgi:quinoprotein glucose dehydrogenase